MSKSLRERRRETALASVARLTEKREAIIASLVAVEVSGSTICHHRRLCRNATRGDRANNRRSLWSRYVWVCGKFVGKSVRGPPKLCVGLLRDVVREHSFERCEK
jgi:hypothetical protein